jgi:hypothetical protein
MDKTIIGIDPGLGGGIAILHEKKLILHKMPEQFMDIVELFKPYAMARCSLEMINLRPKFDRFANSRMDALKTNYVNLQNALSINMINYKEVHPTTWQIFHNLVLPKGTGEKGLDYDILKNLKKDEKHLRIHLSLETKIQNDVVIAQDVKHILETSGRLEARKMLCDDFTYLSKYDLQKAIEQTENDIKKFLSREKTIRKNRYKAKAQGYVPNIKVTLKTCDAILILLYEKYNQTIEL